MIKIICCCVLAALAGCNGNSESGQTKVDKKDSLVRGVNTLSRDLSGCYQLIIERDTALIQITRTGDAVSGHLAYKRFEKDSNEGDFMGNIYPDGKINVWYKFKSEGIISVRQVIFKTKGNTLIEGYGDVIMQHDTAMFKYPTALSYEENHPFIKVACP